MDSQERAPAQPPPPFTDDPSKEEEANARWLKAWAEFVTRDKKYNWECPSGGMKLGYIHGPKGFEGYTYPNLPLLQPNSCTQSPQNEKDGGNRYVIPHKRGMASEASREKSEEPWKERPWDAPEYNRTGGCNRGKYGRSGVWISQ
ncbi:hypothetical protein ABW19_dt0203228 [Dactylella cylindrospora]|nr:hypothetical protein ABW19_dt0203228 [Dactylella cylindrospora]